MFDIAGSELALIAIVALVLLKPQDIPQVIRTVRQGVNKLQAMREEIRQVMLELEAEVSEATSPSAPPLKAVTAQKKVITDDQGKEYEAYDISALPVEGAKKRSQETS